MSIFDKTRKQNSTSLTVIIVSAVLLVGAAFSVGRYLAPPAIQENSEAYILAKAKARGVEMARIKTDAIKKELSTSTYAQLTQAEKTITELKKQVAVIKPVEVPKVVDKMGLAPLSDFDDWKDIGGGWQVRGVHFRDSLSTTDVTIDDKTTTQTKVDGTRFEYALRRTDGQHPKLTRILFEIYDDKKTFLIPGVCDISGTDASLSYVRTGDYDLYGKKPAYYRVSVAPVNTVKYANEYPTSK